MNIYNTSTILEQQLFVQVQCLIILINTNNHHVGEHVQYSVQSTQTTTMLVLQLEHNT